MKEDSQKPKENTMCKRVLRPRTAALTNPSQKTSHGRGKMPTEIFPENQPTLETSTNKHRLQKPATDVNDTVWKLPEGMKSPSIPAVNPFGLRSCNMVHRLYHASLSISQGSRLKQAVVQPYIQQLRNFRIQHTTSPFDRRVTALEWHPTLPKTLAVASKSGDLIMWNYENTAKFNLSKGVGKGGAITNMTFDLMDPSGVYTSSNEGTVCRHCLGKDGDRHIFLDTHSMDRWYCSLSANYARNLLIAGDNSGNLTLMERKSGKRLWTRRLHKSKATHCEFNSRCDWLLATASTDKMVKMWDVRMMSDRKSALYILHHNRPINSAYFSPDCTRLLTTDQYGELRIYAGPLWDRMERSISHPHRFFQHLTPIKATWHPLYDLVVVGRYPDENFPSYQEEESRTIDVFDANSGDMVCQLLDPSVSGIISLNKFSASGDSLASGMGYSMLIWTDVVRLQQIQSEKLQKTPQENGSDSRVSRLPLSNPAPRRRRRRRRDEDDDIGAMKQRLKGKMAKR
ncbi:DNA damage-binding protein 2-like isoform X2 [Acanthaster planci]|uniref:DNA damage-binding protein 2 n=1 Tax=Acanthaster planci TaxID=133434 RepID=A0A8B7YB18_ACAPL|nr:DNA damage-binding protein 2-like isoform X2 [Acanthaster planci]